MFIELDLFAELFDSLLSLRPLVSTVFIIHSVGEPLRHLLLGCCSRELLVLAWVMVALVCLPSIDQLDLLTL